MEKRIFFSYNWNDTEDVNRLDNLFSRFQIHLTRDIRDLKYNANIHNFMDGIQMHDKLILYVSDSYLRSVNCMYEASQVVNMQEKVIIILKKGTQLFSINDKEELINYWKTKCQEIMQMDSYLFQQEIIDTQIACNSIGTFVDFIKRDNRMNEETLDFDILLDSLKVEKSFPTIVNNTVFNWIVKYPQAKLFDVLALINDLYRSASIYFSEFPNIPDDETLYMFRGIQFEGDINGINLLLSITDEETGEDKAIIYSHLVAIEENNIRSNRHAKYYFHCENPSQKQKCREISSQIKYRDATREENELLARGYLDTYRLTVYFNEK